jgi:hypothetical protein
VSSVREQVLAQDAKVRENRDLRERLKVAEEARLRAERELHLMVRLDGRRSKEPPAWLTSTKRKPGTKRGTPWLLLSDLHFDEVVDPAQVGGVNAYNRTIAEQRLRATFEAATNICTNYWSGVTYDGIVAPLAGDLYAGIIHDELRETNAATILDSVLHWSDQLTAGMLMLADTFGKVHVPVVVGNHGRLSRKPRAKYRARDNFDWFTGQLIARALKDDKRFTFQISDAADALVASYGYTVCVTHGDQVNGGSGIGGIWPPIMRLDARKRQRQAAVGQPYDLLALGHWHTLTLGPSWIVNGSLVGYDEYAYVSNFGFEPPAQALWLMTPEHGKTFTAPVLPCHREKEGW